MKNGPLFSTDLVISPFGASANEIIEVAKCADESGFNGVWVLDHFSGKVVNRSWSHEPFTILGAIAAVTDRLNVGPLVANMVNRNPVLLASSFSSLQSLANGRAVLGLGTGAPPGTKFALEQEMIGRELEPEVSKRLKHLAETITSLRSIWKGDSVFQGEYFAFNDLESVVQPETDLQIIVGANGKAMIEFAAQYADGVNIRVGPSIKNLIHLAVSSSSNAEFEISVHEDFDYSHPYGGEFEKWIQWGVHRRACMINAPFDLHGIAEIGQRLSKLAE